MKLPDSHSVPVNVLTTIFNNTTASYKYYWFLSVLEHFCIKSKSKITFREIVIGMICNSWYPIHYFKLNFGIQDQLNQNIIKIRNITNLKIDISKQNLYELLLKEKNKDINNLISHFYKHVPFRFLSPWLKGSNSDIVDLSQNFANKCLYKINLDTEKNIEMNPIWYDYLKQNNRILIDFIFWNLSLYLQNKNPNIPNIVNKLIKPIERQSLTKQRNLWKIVFSELQTINCIYTNKQLNIDGFDLDHFVPWSFVSHDLAWNLVPVDCSINSSKGNKLPNLDMYFEKFTHLQKKAIEIIYKSQPNNKMLEDYLLIGFSAKDIIQMPENIFFQNYYKVISPMMQIASNSGFEIWNL